MSYWKSKVLPKFKKFFDKGKKKGASEVCKNFDKSKESFDKEIEEKSSDLNPKVVEIYKSSTTFIAKKLLKEPKEETVKGNPDAVQGVLQELVKAGFPGAQMICDAGTKFGPALLPGPVVYLFEKASVYLVEEPLPEEPKEETREVSVEDVKAPEDAPPPPPATTEVETPGEASAEPKSALTATLPPPPVEEEKKEETKAEEPPVTPPLPPAAVVEPPPPVVETPAVVDPPAPEAPAPPPPADKTE